MAKSVNSLTGAVKDAYLRQVVVSESDLGTAATERLAERLQAEISRVWVRTSAPAMADPQQETSESEASSSAADFDPYTPNVIVVVRTAGRDRALAALGQIAAAENLRVLAKHQQLGIDPDLATPDEIRSAIIAAAERRIANRRAAAS